MRYIFLSCAGLNNARRDNGGKGKGHDILACVTWLLARGKEEVGGRGMVIFDSEGSRVTVSSDTGRIISVALAGGLSIAECAAGHGPTAA